MKLKVLRTLGRQRWDTGEKVKTERQQGWHLQWCPQNSLNRKPWPGQECVKTQRQSTVSFLDLQACFFIWKILGQTKLFPVVFLVYKSMLLYFWALFDPKKPCYHHCHECLVNSTHPITAGWKRCCNSCVGHTNSKMFVIIERAPSERSVCPGFFR